MKDNPSLKDPDGRFARIVEPVVEGRGCRLVQVRVGGSQAGKGNALEIFIEHKDGSPLAMETCSAISRELGAVLDVEEPIGGAYRLEVGSPGIDRALTDLSDFLRFKGYEAKVELKRPLDDGQRRMRGHITDAHAEGFTLTDDQKRNFDLQMNDLSAARLVASDALFKAISSGNFPKPINQETDSQEAKEA